MTLDGPGVRRLVDHPIVDVDGHVVESIPLLVEVMRSVAGSDVADRFAGSTRSFASRREGLLASMDDREGTPGLFVPPWWTVAASARDRATAFLPNLLHDRLDEIGIDFGVVYSSVGLVCFSHDDDAIRRGSCRALNVYLAELCEGLDDRLTPAAVVPAHTPAEAIEELEFAVLELGLKAATLNCCVAREGPAGPWIDVLALDGLHDYEPVWQRFEDLGVAVTVHSPTMGLPLRQSSTRYTYNHIGTFAASAEAFAKAWVYGGVGARHPGLNVGFLECGVSWGVQLLADLIGRWEKRGGPNIARLDPGRLDRREWDALLDRYGGDRFRSPELRASMLGQSDNAPEALDDFRAAGVDGPEDLAALFERFYFGCEADEATIGAAFAGDNPCGAVLKPVFGSDIGHWDVPEVAGVVVEAHELVEHERLSPAEFRAFTCDNPIDLHAGMNPGFFDGTPVAATARSRLAASVEVGRTGA